MARLMRSSMLKYWDRTILKLQSLRVYLVRGDLKHAVRNAILPIISVLGTLISNLLVGSFVIEKIFGIPGLGSFLLSP